MPIRRPKMTQLAIKVEAAEGTAENVAAADVLAHAEDVTAVFEVAQNERSPHRGSLGAASNTPGNLSGTLSARHPVTAGTDAATVPPVDRLLRALGHQQFVVNTMELAGAPTGTPRAGERFSDDATGAKIGVFLRISGTTVTFLARAGTFAAGEDVTFSITGATATIHATTPAITQVGVGYVPQSTGQESFTAVAIEEGVRKRLFGGRGTGSILTEGAGQVLYLNAELSGAADHPADQALLTGVTKPAIQLLAFKGATVSHGGSSICVGTKTFAFGNTVELRDCANATGGIEAADIVERRSTIEIDPLATTEADVPFFERLEDGAVLGYSFAVGNSTDGEVLIAAPLAQVTGLADADRGGKRAHTLALLLTEDQGDDEYVIAMIAGS